MPKINLKALRSSEGFTLIELLVVISIIAILVVLLAVSFTQIQKSARDKQRITDLQAVAGMLERFYSDNSQYPSSDANGRITYHATDCTTNPVGLTTAAWGSSSIVCNSKNYTRQLPKNPVGGSNNEYCYAANATNQTYSLYADLEKNTGNSYSCNGKTYDYQITSND